MIGITTAIILDARSILNDNTYPVKLRVTHRKKQKYYPTGYSLTKEDYHKVKAEKPRGQYKELQIVFQSIEKKGISIIKKLPAFSFEMFKKQFLNSTPVNDVFFCL